MQSPVKYPFLKYLEDNHCDIFGDAICKFIKDCPDCIADKLRHIVNIDEIIAEELDFKMCWIEDKSDLNIEFDVAIAANLSIEGYSRTVHESESISHTSGVPWRNE